MRVSAKGRYALSSMLVMAQNYENGEYITVVSISDRLGISKIYLEQVFSLLKRGGLVTSVKGSQGGYQLSRGPGKITALDVLEAVELSLFEPSEDTVSEAAPEIDAALRSAVFAPLDEAIKGSLGKTSLSDLVTEAEKNKDDQGLMFFI